MEAIQTISHYSWLKHTFSTETELILKLYVSNQNIKDFKEFWNKLALKKLKLIFISLY